MERARLTPSASIAVCSKCKWMKDTHDQVNAVVTRLPPGYRQPEDAGNQIVGGVVWASARRCMRRPRWTYLGRFMNHVLPEYHLPVQADIGVT